MKKKEHKIPLKYQEKLVPILKRVFTGQSPKLDPTCDNPISAENFYFLIWKYCGWGKPPEEEAKKANGAYQNVRSAVQHMLQEEGILIASNSESENGSTGYFRPTKPEHFDSAYKKAMNLSDYYREKAEEILKIKEETLYKPNPGQLF
jgi:hypothetical protein